MFDVDCAPRGYNAIRRLMRRKPLDRALSRAAGIIYTEMGTSEVYMECVRGGSGERRKNNEGFIRLWIGICGDD